MEVSNKQVQGENKADKAYRKQWEGGELVLM